MVIIMKELLYPNKLVHFRSEMPIHSLASAFDAWAQEKHRWRFQRARAAKILYS